MFNLFPQFLRCCDRVNTCHGFECLALVSDGCILGRGMSVILMGKHRGCFRTGGFVSWLGFSAFGTWFGTVMYSGCSNGNSLWKT